MAAFSVELANARFEQIDGVDEYQQVGPLTTCSSRGSDRRVIDAWSTRVASFSTTDIVTVRLANDIERYGATTTPGLSPPIFADAR